MYANLHFSHVLVFATSMNLALQCDTEEEHFQWKYCIFESDPPPSDRSSQKTKFQMNRCFMYKELRDIQKLLRVKRQLVMNMSEEEESYTYVISVVLQPLKMHITKWTASFCHRCRLNYDRHGYSFRLDQKSISDLISGRIGQPQRTYALKGTLRRFRDLLGRFKVESRKCLPKSTVKPRITSGQMRAPRRQ